jgi:protein SCO1/2
LCGVGCAVWFLCLGPGRPILLGAMLDSESTPPKRARRGMALGRRDLINLALLLAIVGVVSSQLIHSGKPGLRAPDGAVATQRSQYAGLELGNPKPAPGLVLRNYLGGPVNIASYRGKAVLVTFLYTHCPDVCPLIASKLHTALGEMSAAERARVQIIAVSVDPRGDTRATVAQFLAVHGMAGRMKFLIGSARALAAVWATWGVGSRRETADPSLVAHTALIYGITAKGKIVTIYPASFNPSQIVHDVPILAAS